MDASTSTLPPSYPLPPSYTLDASPDERVLSRTDRRRNPAPEVPRITLVMKLAEATVALNNVQVGELPTYSRGDVVDGTITLASTKRLSRVQVSLEGRLKCTFGESGAPDTFKFLSMDYSIWDHPHPSADQVDALGFVVPLPATFDDNGTERPLPPSYTFGRNDVFNTAIEYRLVVRITRSSAILPGLTSTQRLVVPVAYKPRLRQPRAPLSRSATLLDTLKAAPDEWSNVEFAAGALRCELVFPASRVFSVGQIVPIHVQLAGVTTSAKFPKKSHTYLHAHDQPHLHPSDLPSYESLTRSSVSLHSSSSSATLVSEQDTSDDLPVVVSVRLERRIVIFGPLGTTWRSETLATATLHTVNASADWYAIDGTLTVPENAALGQSLRVGALGIVDSLVLSVQGVRQERRVPVVVVSESFFGPDSPDDDELYQ